MIRYNRNADGTYGPTNPIGNGPGIYYRPNPVHARTARKSRHKTRWKIDEGYEFFVFKISAENEYSCAQNNCLFSLVDDGDVILGENGEVVAKFPNVQNTNEPWHGFPVKCMDSQNIPDDELLDRMRVDDFISESTRQRIEKRKI